MASFSTLPVVANVSECEFVQPSKRIHDGQDVAFFLTSLAYRDIVTFMLQLNHSVVPRKIIKDGKSSIQTWPLGTGDDAYSEPIQKLRTLLQKLNSFIQDVPPDTGPRRFGNVSFRKWYELVQQQIQSILQEILPINLTPSLKELEAYLMGSFGSPQRLDYGTGHELSFLAFLAALWKLGFFNITEAGVEERAIVLGVFEAYLDLIRSLIKTYTLEPAGSHGVWGLDDNSFLPYTFGSAQLCPPISEDDETPVEGSLPNAPEPSSVANSNMVEREKASNMYFSAIAFIYEVKKGPFWEHSPMLYDISGIKDGWGKINKGMIKMYNAEVLSKFPVVQHFPFGSLFKWEKDPEAKEPAASTHTSSQPLRNPMGAHPTSTARPGGAPTMGAGTAAPWANRSQGAPVGFVNGVTQAPWATRPPAPPARSPQAPLRRPEPPTLEKPGPPPPTK